MQELIARNQRIFTNPLGKDNTGRFVEVGRTGAVLVPNSRKMFSFFTRI